SASLPPLLSPLSPYTTLFRSLYPPGLPPVRLQQIPTDHARPILLRVGKGQQCGQTVPGHRVGQDGHKTLPVFHNSCSCWRRGRMAHEVKIDVAREKLEIKPACSCATTGSPWVCSKLAAGPSGSTQTGESGSLLNRR